MPQLEKNFVQLSEGLTARRLANSFAHLRIHYTADPLKRGDWSQRHSVLYGGRDSPNWLREQEIDYNAYSGQRIWPFLCNFHDAQYDMKDWTVYRIIDQGIRHPTVCLWIGVNQKKDRHVFREYYSKGHSIAENCRNILEIDKNEIISGNWIDPACRKRNEIDLTAIADKFADNGISCNYADNSFAGYDTVSQMALSTLARKALDGMDIPYIKELKASKEQLYMLAEKPALTFDFRFTNQCWIEMCGLRWKQFKGDVTQTAQKETPVDIYDDGSDCVRYACQSQLSAREKPNRNLSVLDIMKKHREILERRALVDKGRRRAYAC